MGTGVVLRSFRVVSGIGHMSSILCGDTMVPIIE